MSHTFSTASSQYSQQPSFSNQYARSFSNASAQQQLPTQSYQSSGLSRSRSILSVGSNHQQQAYAVSASASHQNPHSEVEQAMLQAQNPIQINEREQITVNGVRGIHANKSELTNWRGPIPLEQYQLNNDSNPEVVRKRPTEKLKYTQETAVRYLQPPTPQQPGDLIIKQLPGRQGPPAPPLVIRHLPKQPCSPPPKVIREAPPRPPSVFESKVIRIPSKPFPPPPRRVVVEKFAPEPPKPAPIIIEKWLPYKPRKVKVILQKQDPCACNCQQEQQSQLPVNTGNNNSNGVIPELEGDQEALEALRRVDLESYGLNEYRQALNRLH